jgi:hypothetical protein
MKIKQIISQHRRDFIAKIICENCGYEELLTTGYDDRNYHDNVIPQMKCNACGLSRHELGIKGQYFQTQYPQGVTV